MSLCVFKNLFVCLCVPPLGFHAPLVFPAVSVRGAARLGFLCLRCFGGVPWSFLFLLLVLCLLFVVPLLVSTTRSLLLTLATILSIQLLRLALAILIMLLCIHTTALTTIKALLLLVKIFATCLSVCESDLALFVIAQGD